MDVAHACAAANLTEFGRMQRQYRLSATDASWAPCAPYAAWLGVIRATPWRSHEGEWEQALYGAYAHWEPGMRVSLSIGARALDQLGEPAKVAIVGLFNTDDIEACLVRGVGPIAIGLQWRDGFELPDPMGVLHNNGKKLGGHAIVLTGIDRHRGVIRIANNQGVLWGQAGRAWIGVHDLRARMQDGFEAYSILPMPTVAKTTAKIYGLPE